MAIQRSALPAGNYATIVGEAVVAVIERKTLGNLATSLSDGGLAFQMQRLADVLEDKVGQPEIVRRIHIRRSFERIPKLFHRQRLFPTTAASAFSCQSRSRYTRSAGIIGVYLVSGLPLRTEPGYSRSEPRDGSLTRASAPELRPDGPGAQRLTCMCDARSRKRGA